MLEIELQGCGHWKVFAEFAICIVAVYFSRLQSPDPPQVIYLALYFGSMFDIPRMATARVGKLCWQRQSIVPDAKESREFSP